MRLKYISTSIFHQGSGTLLLATQKVFKYNLRVDHDTKIQIDKQHTVSQTYLKQLKKTLLRTRQLKKADDIQEEDGTQEKDQDRMVNRDQLEFEIFDSSKLALNKHKQDIRDSL